MSGLGISLRQPLLVYQWNDLPVQGQRKLAKQNVDLPQL